MVGGMEIITGVERRRRWRLEDKLRIVAEAERPGACFVEIARRHEIGRSVLWSWRRQVREGVLAAEPTPDPPAAASVPAEPATGPAKLASDKAAARIEIALPDGTVIRVDEAIGAAALRRVMAAVRA